jgi:hypothetical protein
MCVDCVLASPRVTKVDPGGEPLSEVVLSQLHHRRKEYLDATFKGYCKGAS